MENLAKNIQNCITGRVLIDFNNFFYTDGYRSEVNYNKLLVITNTSISEFSALSYQSLGRFMKFPKN